jgi:hypothetical protein
MEQTLVLGRWQRTLSSVEKLRAEKLTLWRPATKQEQVALTEPQYLTDWAIALAAVPH